MISTRRTRSALHAAFDNRFAARRMSGLNGSHVLQLQNAFGAIDLPLGQIEAVKTALGEFEDQVQADEARDLDRTRPEFVPLVGKWR